jgi:hypothetical protein
MGDSLEAAAFRRAAEIFGGATPLSHWLKVPLDALRKWISGEEPPPQLPYRQVLQILNVRDAQARSGELQLSTTNSTPSALGVGVRVLVASNDRDIVMTYGVLLRSEGFELRLMLGVADVVRTAMEFRPHAVVLDPADFQGHAKDVARELETASEDPAPMLIAMTKPVDQESLLSLLASLKK